MRRDGKPLTSNQTLYIGIFFLLIGLAIAYFGSTDTKLSCSKSSNLCTVEKTKIWILKNTKYIALSDLMEAQVKKTGFRRGNGRRHSFTRGADITGVVLLTRMEEIPLASSDIPDMSEQNNDCQKINNFLKSNEKNLEIVYPGLLIIKLFGLFLALVSIQIMSYRNGYTETSSPVKNFIWAIGFLLVGSAMLYFLGLDIKFSCSRSTNMCTIEKTNMIGSKDVKYISLSQLTGASVKSYKGPYRNTGVNSRIVLLTQKEEVPLASVSSATQNFFELLQVPSPDYLAFNSTDCQKINHYINSQYEKLELSYSTLIIRIIGSILVGLGLLALLPESKEKI